MPLSAGVESQEADEFYDSQKGSSTKFFMAFLAIYADIRL
jgi:hypothetical protein